jgi:hypothetical protein
MIRSLPILLFVICFNSCSLVTVPVKTAGAIVETSIKTTGKIVTAPFDRGGSDEESSKEEKE